MNQPVDSILPEPREGEHPFAPYVRILGRGKRGARSLSQAEARHAMSLILQGDVEDTQLGAFLMLLRVKEETAAELTGFVQAVREHTQVPTGLSVDLDWPSYAGKRRHPPWFLFAILLLAQHGLRVFIHGADGHTPERLYLRPTLAAFGLAPATSWTEAAQQLAARQFTYLPLAAWSPQLADIIELRPILGLRSPVHSLARLINPLTAPVTLQGIFHPPYGPLHQESGRLLGYPRTVVIRGEGGESERNPDNALTVLRANGAGDTDEVSWPALFERRHVKPKSLSLHHMYAVWSGAATDSYGEAAVLSTAALALLETGAAASQSAAWELAHTLWEHRDRHRFEQAPVATRPASPAV
ncbi:glycosyl transferase family protein [Marinobacter sp. X15-166B]|uniref:glycosyl transferase family protein n=1 Tax=Marinobacter sp. X15-166B TaxID=1897620 RepID=UPI000A7B87DF|nr:glycosyl transferase family protein [Marinobacter sp. X15-166B]